MRQPTAKVYNAALYMRLSRDDTNYGDSVSIESQRMILRKYAEDHHLQIYDEYVDDGWSGTNFDRPDFQRMMQDVNDGKVNCIITKDLSRFGREHVVMDYYLEFVFPEKHVRYIAVSENEDTEQGLSDFVPFKNLFNEWHAKDTSRKIKAVFKVKFAAGEYICAHPPIGYKRHPEIKNKIVVDDETKWIVVKIFELAAQGKGASAISRILYREKVPTPAWINFQRYGTFAHVFVDAEEDKKYTWHITQVKNILKNEIYIGNCVHNKASTVSYKNKKIVAKPKDEWLRVENTHEAIISKELFLQVQDQIASRRRRQKDGTTQIFAGLLKCADCGLSMGINRHHGFAYYICDTYRRGLHKCTQHYTKYDALYVYVLSRIQYWSKQVQKGSDHVLQKLLNDSGKEQLAEKQKNLFELKNAEKRKADVDRMFAKIYEDWATERITEYNFKLLSEKYQGEQLELDKKIHQLREAEKLVEQDIDNAEKWIALMKEYENPKELTAEMLNTLIEKIVVHEAIKQENGTKEQEIEIHYRFVGKID